MISIVMIAYEVAPYLPRAMESSQKGISIFKHDKNGKVADAYDRLTKEVISLEQRETARRRTEECVR